VAHDKVSGVKNKIKLISPECNYVPVIIAGSVIHSKIQDEVLRYYEYAETTVRKMYVGNLCMEDTVAWKNGTLFVSYVRSAGSGISAIKMRKAIASYAAHTVKA
jgi:hypothetical protein